ESRPGAVVVLAHGPPGVAGSWLGAARGVAAWVAGSPAAGSPPVVAAPAPGSSPGSSPGVAGSSSRCPPGVADSPPGLSPGVAVGVAGSLAAARPPTAGVTDPPEVARVAPRTASQPQASGHAMTACHTPASNNTTGPATTAASGASRHANRRPRAANVATSISNWDTTRVL